MLRGARRCTARAGTRRPPCACSATTSTPRSPRTRPGTSSTAARGAPPNLSGRTILTAGLGGLGGAQPLAAWLAGAASLSVEVDPHRIERRIETRYLDEVADDLDDAIARVTAYARDGRGISVGLLGNAGDVFPEP